MELSHILLSLVLLFCTCLGFRRDTVHYANGHKYTISIEQPFFRVEHKEHEPIPEKYKNRTTFGKSMVPDGDVFVPHNWTDVEKEYLGCTTLTCVCPYFNGSVIGDVCMLENGKQLERALRKDYRMLTDEEREQVEKAFNAMHTAGVYTRIGRVHKYAGVHSGPGFFTWHREYLKRVELIFRTYLPPGSNLGLPYWDSTTDAQLPTVADSIFFTEHLVGDTDRQGRLIKGAYANWTTMDGNPVNLRQLGADPAGELFNDARVDLVLDQAQVAAVLAPSLPLDTCSILENVTLDDRMLEYSHDYIHYYIGGTFAPTYSSTDDVIFWLHHAFVDSIWELWRQKQQTREMREAEYPPDDPNCYPEEHFGDSSLREMEDRTNRDALSNNYTDFMYQYAPRPRCTLQNPDCGSKFFFCHKTFQPFPKCMSKVRLGGNCKGFEKFDVCYEGTCHNGKCAAEGSFEEIVRSSSPVHSALFATFICSIIARLQY